MNKKPKLREEIDKIVLAVATEKVKNLRADAKKQVESALLSLIGLEKKYGGDIEIDHCNGRNSILIDAFKNIARDEVEKLARTYKPTKEDIASFQKAFRDEYANQLRYAIRDIIKQKVQKDVEAYLTENNISVEKAIEDALGK